MCLRDEMNKTRSHLHIFSKKITHVALNFHQPSESSSFFGIVRFVSDQLISSPSFSLIGAASPPVNITTPPHCVMLLSHMNSLSPLHLLSTLISSRHLRAMFRITWYWGISNYWYACWVKSHGLLTFYAEVSRVGGPPVKWSWYRRDNGIASMVFWVVY
jgi:hypothetical protein